MGAIHIDVGRADMALGADVDPALAAIGFGRLFLELLDQEAPAVEFERPLAEARAAGAPAGLLAGLDAMKLVALRISAELEQRRRREAELAALFETAGDLAALHDLDAVLRAIVHRARLLLGTDVAYLTLHDRAAEDTFMRVTSGSVSPYFQHVRLARGWVGWVGWLLRLPPRTSPRTTSPTSDSCTRTRSTEPCARRASWQSSGFRCCSASW